MPRNFIDRFVRKSPDRHATKTFSPESNEHKRISAYFEPLVERLTTQVNEKNNLPTLGKLLLNTFNNYLLEIKPQLLFRDYPITYQEGVYNITEMRSEDYQKAIDSGQLDEVLRENNHIILGGFTVDIYELDSGNVAFLYVAGSYVFNATLSLSLVVFTENKPIREQITTIFGTEYAELNLNSNTIVIDNERLPSFPSTLRYLGPIPATKQDEDSLVVYYHFQERTRTPRKKKKEVTEPEGKTSRQLKKRLREAFGSSSG